MPTPTKAYQEIIYSLLQTKMAELADLDRPEELEVKKEWPAFTGIPYRYSPRVDIVVGPFSTRSGKRKTRDYDRLIKQDNINSFLKRLYGFHKKNIGEEKGYENIEKKYIVPSFDDLLHKNQNARCFLAFEIENKNGNKHIMGSLINAASLGRIGIGIAYSPEVLRTFIRILNYLAFLKRVDKPTYDATNFLIITKEQMQTLLENPNG